MIDLADADLEVGRLAPDDSPKLQLLLQMLVGQPFQFFRASYGDEVKLHLGELRPYSRDAMNSRLRGSFIVAPRASHFLAIPVFSPNSRYIQGSGRPDKRFEAGPIDRVNCERETIIAQGDVVKSVNVNWASGGYSLRLEFPNAILSIIPASVDPWGERCEIGEDEAEEGPVSNVADWEILTPFQKVLQVGPGHRSEYIDSSTRRGS